MSDEHKVHSGYVRRFKTPDGGHAELTMNCSGIAPTDSDDMIRIMVGRGQVALELMMDEVERKASDILSSVAPLSRQAPRVTATPVAQSQPKLNANAFSPAPPEPTGTIVKPEPAPIAQAVQAINDGATKSFDSNTHTHDPFETDKQFIPYSSEVSIGSTAFGIQINWPPVDWTGYPITEINADGTKGGQMLALNAGLTAINCGKGDRHTACEEILRAYGPIHSLHLREAVGSLRELTKAEASVCLEWIANAEQQHIQQLHVAMGGVSQSVQEEQECII